MLERRQTVNFRVNMKQRGDMFGEVALMYNVPRSATVAATKDSVVWVLERDIYRCENAERSFVSHGHWRRQGPGMGA